MSRLSAALRAHDQELWAHLEGRNGVNPQLYAFRWVTTLLTQEFSFPDAVRVWDALLSDPGGREEGLQRVCLAMVLLVRDEVKRAGGGIRLPALSACIQSCVRMAVTTRAAPARRLSCTLLCCAVGARAPARPRARAPRSPFY